MLLGRFFVSKTSPHEREQLKLRLRELKGEEKARIVGKILDAEAFGTLCMSRLVHGFNCKDDKPVIFSKRFFNNKYLIGAFVLGTVLITGVLTIPGLHAMFKVVTLNMTQLMTVYGLAFLNLPVIQGLKYLKGKTKWN